MRAQGLLFYRPQYLSCQFIDFVLIILGKMYIIGSRFKGAMSSCRAKNVKFFLYRMCYQAHNAVFKTFKKNKKTSKDV